MKRIILYALVTVLFANTTYSQDVTGLWKGTIYNDSTKKSLPYEIVIAKEKGKLTGWTHTFFTVNDNMYYGIKKVKVRVAKDGKVIILDDAMLENNYPSIDKNVQQLNVLDITTAENNFTLDGPFETNRTKQYGVLTGHISVKKVTPGTESALVDYLQKNNVENAVAASK